MFVTFSLLKVIDMTEIQPWGFELRIDGQANAAAIRDPEHIANFSRELVKRIDMVAYGEPQVVHFGEDEKAGYTLIQLIETSNICAHFCEETDTFYLNVFSCKLFEPQTVFNVLVEYFNAVVTFNDFVKRNA